MFDWNACLSVGHGTEVLEGLHHILRSVVSLLLFISGKTKCLLEGCLLWEIALPLHQFHCTNSIDGWKMAFNDGSFLLFLFYSSL